MELLLKSKPEVNALVLSNLRENYKRITGKNPAFDSDQFPTLAEHPSSGTGTWKSQYSSIEFNAWKVIDIFTDGFLQKNFAPDEALNIATEFYAMLDRMYFNEN